MFVSSVGLAITSQKYLLFDLYQVFSTHETYVALFVLCYSHAFL